MKSIGPYVILATSHGARLHGAGINGVGGTVAGADGQLADRKAEPGDSAPLHALDRLTGMPVLLHRLEEVVIPVALPDSASLLPVSEVAVWDGHAYAVTELSPAAVPAIHPDLAALGALRGLAALHGAGQIHGGLNAGQLWRLGREVRLAGAGLPWQQGAGDGLQALDMSALGRTLDTLGVRPASLASLESMTASQALEALETALAEQERQKASANSIPTSSVAPKLVLVRPKPEPSVPQKKVPAKKVSADPVPTPTASVPPLPAPSVPSTPPAAAPAVSAPEIEQRPSEEPAPAAPSRYRAADDVVVLGEAPAPAGELSQPSPAVVQADASPLSVIRAVPIRIGFNEPPAPLPDWEPLEQANAEGAEQNGGQALEVDPESVSNGKDSLKADRPEEGELEPVAPLFLPSEAETLAAGAAASSPASARASTAPGTVTPANRGQPLRIGWEEDHSWRVVKSGPARSRSERRRTAAPQLSSGTPRILLLALALLVGAGVWYWSSGRGNTSVSGCCTQRFTVSGSSGPVKVTLLVAPPGSPLQPGALIGTAPGTLKFPNVPGSYTLKFNAAGHAAMTSTVNVPSSRPFGIVLK